MALPFGGPRCRISPPGGKFFRLQSSNSSGPLANSPIGEPFRKRIDSPRRPWWRQPAFEVRDLPEEMEALLCYRLQLPVGSTYASGAAVLMTALADQTSLPWPDEFSRKIRVDGVAQPSSRWPRIRCKIGWLFDRNGHYTGAHHTQRAGSAD
jgi:hypothetical protein